MIHPNTVERTIIIIEKTNEFTDIRVARCLDGIMSLSRIKRRKQDTEKYSRQAACRRKSGNKNRSNSSKKRKSGEKLWVL